MSTGTQVYWTAGYSPQRRDAAPGMVRTPVNRAEYEDRYAAKLVKYIPAEVLAAFIPLIALANEIKASKEVWLWVTVGIGAACTIGYSRWQSTDVLKKQIEAAHGEWPQERVDREYKFLQPHVYYYALALVAFAAWALATAQPARALIGMDATQSEFVVAAVALVLPLADVTLRHLVEWFPPAPRTSETGSKALGAGR